MLLINFIIPTSKEKLLFFGWVRIVTWLSTCSCKAKDHLPGEGDCLNKETFASSNTQTFDAFERQCCTESLWNICWSHNLKVTIICNCMTAYLTTNRLTKDHKAVWSILEVLCSIQNSVKGFEKTHKYISGF